MWHFPGSPLFLARQAKRLGLDRGPVDHVKACGPNPDLYKISNILGQICGRFAEELRAGTLRKADLTPISATLDRCEREVRNLHLAAAAGEDMLAEAYRVFGIARRPNPYVILSEFDEQPLPELPPLQPAEVTPGAPPPEDDE